MQTEGKRCGGGCERPKYYHSTGERSAKSSLTAENLLRLRLDGSLVYVSVWEIVKEGAGKEADDHPSSEADDPRSLDDRPLA